MLFLFAVVIDSVFNLGKHYYPPAPLQEFQEKIKEREIKSLIVDNLKSSSDEDISYNDDSSCEKDDIDYPHFVGDNHDPLETSPLSIKKTNM